MQSLNKNGVSITQTLGEEKFVKCRLSAFKGQTFYQYDYRHTGTLDLRSKQEMR